VHPGIYPQALMEHRRSVLDPIRPINGQGATTPAALTASLAIPIVVKKSPYVGSS